MPRPEESKWSQWIARWKVEQEELRQRVAVTPLRDLPRYVAGADAAYSADNTQVIAAAVVYDRIEARLVEIAKAIRPIEVPYIPGYLSFREGPAVLAAIQSLKHEFGAVCFDGQGYAHPRRCGLASHLGVTLDLPAIGCAKSRLIGTFDEPGPLRGDSSPLMDKAEQIGAVLRTQDGVRPIFVSVGHRVDLGSALELVMACCGRYRLPEPTRQADRIVGDLKRGV